MIGHAFFCRAGVFLTSCLLASVATFATAANTETLSKPPNVLMICIDDLNDWTGFLGGHPQAHTPHMDALAKRGMSFTNAHCAVPVCSASRISVMSGLPATTHGSYELGPAYDQLPALRDIPTLQRAFKDRGYLTIEGGKVLHHGFTGRIAADIDRSLGRTSSPRPQGPMNRPASWSGAWDWGAYPEADAEMADWQLAEAAAATLSETFPQPFFLSVGFFRPHVPLFVPPKWFDRYPAESLTLAETPAADLLDLPPNFLTINDYAAAPTHAEVVASGSQRGLTQAYLASISFVDHCVGRVLGALAASPHAETTIVVLWSDHGFHLGEKHHWAKRTLWEESTRVPLLFAGPGVQANAVCQEPASLIDLYPTLLELCGLAPQPHPAGLSLVPQLRDSTTLREQPAIISSYEGNHAIRSKDWRLIHYRDAAEELYDHSTDPDERTNLADVPAHQERKQALRQWLPVSAAAEVKPQSERPLAAVDEPPNIIVIISDDQGWADIGVNNPRVFSPNLDRLAAEGITFTQHYVMPQCTPTRVALLTGRYPGRFGGPALSASNQPAFPHGTPTLASMLQQRGYTTAMAGKWHLASTPDFGPNVFGFHSSYGSLAGAVGMYDHRYRTGEFEHTWHRDHTLIEGAENGTHATDLITNEAIRVIEQDHEKPFFLYLPYHSVHTPLDERGPFPDRPTQLDPDNPTRWLNESDIRWFNDPEGKIQSEHDPEKRLLLAAVYHLDDAIGRVVQSLDDNGLRENTLILFSSDNGPQGSWGGNAYPDDLKLTDFNQPLPFRGKKVDVWEGGIHVPAFANWPGRLQPREEPTPVHIVDWFPTIAAIAQVTERPDVAWDGVDLGPLLFDGEPSAPRDFYWTWASPVNRWALRYGDWKVVKYGRGAPQAATDWQLFNLALDPDESDNVAEEHPEILRELHDRFVQQRGKDHR